MTHNQADVVTALEARNVTKIFGGEVTALDGVDLRVERGETVALVGESGCGKTTLLRLFNRMETPTSGTVLLHGTSVAEGSPIPLRRQLGYVQQEGGLLPHWTVERNIGLVPSLIGWDAERTTARTYELLELVGLQPEDYAARYPADLSGGQRQRVAFARAVAADPDVILLDEPFGALDAITRLELQDQFLDLKQRLGKTFLIVTHDLGEAFRLSDRVAVMRHGRVLQVASGPQLRAHPEDPYVERLLELGGNRA